MAAFDSAVSGTVNELKNGPAGRGLHPRGSALSLWYNRLPAGDQQMVTEAVRDAARAAVFGFLCVLDGVRVIDDPPHVDLWLTAVDQHGVTTTLASAPGGSTTSSTDSYTRPVSRGDRKSTRLNSSHVRISYAVFCLKKHTTIPITPPPKPYEERSPRKN